MRRNEPVVKTLWNRRPPMILFGVLLVLSSFAACTPNRRIMESSRTPTPAAEGSPAPNTVDDDIRAMRSAGFKFIVVIRRRDGGAMDAEDRAVINANSPPDANRRKLAEEGRAVIIGTNFPFYPGSIANLAERFALENLSQPDAGPIEVDRTGNVNAASPSPTAKR